MQSLNVITVQTSVYIYRLTITYVSESFSSIFKKPTELYGLELWSSDCSDLLRRMGYFRDLMNGTV